MPLTRLYQITLRYVHAPESRLLIEATSRKQALAIAKRRSLALYPALPYIPLCDTVSQPVPPPG